MGMNGVKLLAFLICWFMCVSAQGAEPFKFRGYYVTFMRMPVMGLPEWKEAIDCFAEDDINVLILWTAGGFRSKKFPITWQYNQDHANVRNDFARELIDYAHTKNIRSEEHTSELQSHSDLVCRLLLEKKKTHKKITKS